MPPPRSDFDRELQALEAELRRLEAEYNMFFAGRLPRLPWDQRTRVDTLMKRYDRMHIQNTGDRFRFQTIQSRWAAFSELWDRQLKAQEQGRLRPGRSRETIAPPATSVPADTAAPPEPAAPDAAGGGDTDRIVAMAMLSNPAEQTERVQQLYSKMAEARRETGDKPIEYERFTELVSAQVRKLGADGHDVAFRVTLKDGKVTLTAERVD